LINPYSDITNLSASLPSFDDIKHLDIHVEWIVEQAVPKNCVVLFAGRRGIGKTWFTFRMIENILQGKQFLGLNTTPIPVFYIDFENPLPVVVDRINILAETWETRNQPASYWHRYHDVAPPRIDTEHWIEYRRLVEESGNECLIVFDTLRSSQMQNINDDQDSAKIMERLKHLSDLGATVLLLHHTPKYDPTTFKGSGTIADLVDHVLLIKDTSDPGVYSYGTLEKTRYDHFEVFLTHAGNHDFVVQDDPFEQEMQGIVAFIKGNPGRNQSAIKKEFPAKVYPHYSSASTWGAKLAKGEELGYFSSKKEGNQRLYY
jgi:hypothetical protein